MKLEKGPCVCNYMECPTKNKRKEQKIENIMWTMMQLTFDDITSLFALDIMYV